jgi:hypothetical protein
VNTCFAVPLYKPIRKELSLNHFFGVQTPSKLMRSVPKPITVLDNREATCILVDRCTVFQYYLVNLSQTGTLGEHFNFFFFYGKELLALRQTQHPDAKSAVP